MDESGSAAFSVLFMAFLKNECLPKAGEGVEPTSNLAKLSPSDEFPNSPVPSGALEVLLTVGNTKIACVVDGPLATASPFARCSAVLDAGSREIVAAPSLSDIPT